MMDANYKYYMTAVQLNKVYNNNLTDEQILERYDKIQATLDKIIAKEPKKAAKLKSMKSDIDDILGQIITMDCEKVRNIYGPKFKANPKDTDTAEKIFYWMLKDKCTDDPMWVEAGKVLIQTKPSLVVNVGMWLERFVIVVTSLERDFLPSSWGQYFPTVWDWATAAA